MNIWQRFEGSYWYSDYCWAETSYSGGHGISL